MGSSAEMADSWVNDPGPMAPQDTHSSSRAAGATLAVVCGVLIVAVAVWLRFLSGTSAAPVPESMTANAHAAAASTAAPATVTPSPKAAPSGAAAGEPQTTTSAMPQLASSNSTEPTVDGDWLNRVAAATGISRRALQAYSGAQLELEREQPSCKLGWNTLAAIGKIESNNGRVLTAAGYSTAAILGPEVEENLHAEGPMQFMPATWAKWGADGNGDGVADPNQIDDAALAAARYLCSYGTLDTPASWHAAVFGYNHLESYVAEVGAQATLYARAAAGI